jgi:single-strand DNA-binding protein
MASVNCWYGIGNVGKDPELKYLPNGDTVANLSLATSEVWKDKDGNKQEKTQWHRLTFYRKLAEIVGEYVKKGSQLYVEGRVEYREYEKDGVKRYSTEIICNQMQMLGGKPSGDAPSKQEPAPAKSKTKPGDDPFDDDVPF